MTSRAAPLLLLMAAIGFWGAATAPTWAAGGDTAALAAAMNDAVATLQDGLKASEREGTPISAKFEIEDGKLQLSVYTMKGNDFAQVVADPKTGAIAKAERITEAEDLKAAALQKAAMAKAKVPLLTAVETAVKANTGYSQEPRAVSIFPELKNGQATAEVTLLAGHTFKKVMQKLDLPCESGRSNQADSRDRRSAGNHRRLGPAPPTPARLSITRRSSSIRFSE
jgi:hypothetical protein